MLRIDSTKTRIRKSSRKSCAYISFHQVYQYQTSKRTNQLQNTASTLLILNAHTKCNVANTSHMHIKEYAQYMKVFSKWWVGRWMDWAHASTSKSHICGVKRNCGHYIIIVPMHQMQKAGNWFYIANPASRILALYSHFRRRRRRCSSSNVTSLHISTIGHFRPHKPNIF